MVCAFGRGSGGVREDLGGGPGGLGAPFGRLRGRLGPFLAALEPIFAVLALCWPLLGRSWSLLGRSWAALSRPWVTLGPLLGRSWATLGRQDAQVEVPRGHQSQYFLKNADFQKVLEFLIKNNENALLKGPKTSQDASKNAFGTLLIALGPLLDRC